MARLKLNLAGDQPIAEYFEGVDARLREIGASRAALAREMDIAPEQLSRYFTSSDPNPTAKTLVAIEESIVTLRRRAAQKGKP